MKTNRFRVITLKHKLKVVRKKQKTVGAMRKLGEAGKRQTETYLFECG